MAKKWLCNVELPRSSDPDVNRIRKEHGFTRIRCEHEPGHKGNHRGRNKFGVYEWWNEADNPQKEIR